MKKEVNSDTKTPLKVTVRFAGDSGDGMQLTGGRFTEASAQAGNDVATRPDFPAEIRAPAGSLPGVSAFQVQFGNVEVFTAGDSPDVLVAMNPAALKAHVSDLKANGTLICNSDAFTKRNLSRVEYTENPLEDEDLSTRFTLVSVPVTALTHEAVKDLNLPKTTADRCKNFFALGVASWMYGRDVESTRTWIKQKFAKAPEIVQANILALEGGMAYAQASELFPSQIEVGPASLKKGNYRNVTGNTGIAYGLAAVAQKSGLNVFYGSYPITPASDILHEVSKHKNFGLLTFQAEDEIAACCSAIGAAFAGHLGVTASSGPGIILKQEAIGLAVTAELPLLVINVQRAGPSTGMPTKVEQSDLLEVLYGRNGECPVVVIAVSNPADAFDATYEAARVALEHMVPVFLLSDASIGAGSQPWRIPDASSLPSISPPFASGAGPYQPYARNEETLVREWAVPGQAGFEHRLGGLEKRDIDGGISYDPQNHEHMVKVRAEKIERIANTLPASHIDGAGSGDLLILGWGSTHGAILGAVQEAQQQGIAVSHMHLRYLNPLPLDLETICSNFKEVLVPELNTGQLTLLLRSKLLRDIKLLSKVQGQPFTIQEILDAIYSLTTDGQAKLRA